MRKDYGGDGAMAAFSGVNATALFGARPLPRAAFSR